MSYPAEGLESIYRNPYVQTKKFLDTHHKGHYRVYNLRIEKPYDKTKFDQMVDYPFYDHQAPPFMLLIDFCKDATKWLDVDEKNVVVVHCKAGKGRTGTMISCLLLHSHLCETATEAMACYGTKRTKDSRGVTIPSQIRYVEYYEYMLKHALTYKENKSVVITDIVFYCLHWRCSLLKVTDKDGHILYETIMTDMESRRTGDRTVLNGIHIPAIQGDFRLTMLTDRNTIIFSAWFNAQFMLFIHTDRRMIVKKEALDIPRKSVQPVELDDEFSMEIDFIDKVEC